jgi:competence protein ComEA
MAEDRTRARSSTLHLSAPAHASKRGGEAAPPRLARLADRARALGARVRASTWGPIALRVGAVALALVVLAWIGRAAAAGPPASASLTALEADAAAGLAGSAAAGATLDAGARSVGAFEAASPPAGPVPPAPPGAPGSSRAHASSTDPVFLNHAGVDELRRLPGVGPKRAEAILVLRQRLGRFQRVEDLLRVKGVGRGAVKKWRPLVRLDTPSPPDGGAVP